MWYYWIVIINIMTQNGETEVSEAYSNSLDRSVLHHYTILFFCGIWVHTSLRNNHCTTCFVCFITKMENKTSKIIFAASGVIALGATLYWVWKKFIDIDDDEEEAQVVIVFIFND